MKKGKRYLALTLALLLPVVWAAGCGSGNPPESGGGVGTRRTVGEIAAGEMPADFPFFLDLGLLRRQLLRQRHRQAGKNLRRHPAGRVYRHLFSGSGGVGGGVAGDLPDRGVSVPDNYDPHKGQMASSPSMTLILTVQAAGGEKTIACREISLGYRAKNPSGQRFLSGCQAIVQRLESSAAWQALPEYEFLYD